MRRKLRQLENAPGPGVEGPKALTPALPRAGSATHSDNAALSCELGLDRGSPQCVLQSNVPWAVTGY